MREYDEILHRRNRVQRHQYRDDPLAVAKELRRLVYAANYERNPATTRRALQDAVACGATFLSVAPHLTNAMEAAQTSVILNHVYNSLGLRVHALRVAVHAIAASKS